MPITIPEKEKKTVIQTLRLRENELRLARLKIWAAVSELVNSLTMQP